MWRRKKSHATAHRIGRNQSFCRPSRPPSPPPHFLSSFHIFPCPFTRSPPALFSFLLLLLLSIWTLFFPPLSPLPRKPINLQAEPRAFFLFITRSGHVWLSVSLALTTLCVHARASVCVNLCVCFRASVCVPAPICVQDYFSARSGQHQAKPA